MTTKKRPEQKDVHEISVDEAYAVIEAVRRKEIEEFERRLEALCREYNLVPEIKAELVFRPRENNR